MPDTVEALLRRQKALADFGDLALRSDDLDEVLHEACRLVAGALGTGRAKVLEVEPGGESLLVRAGVGWDARVVGQVRIPMGERSSESYSIAAGHPVITRDVAQEERFDLPKFMRDAGVRALANVPVFLPGQRAWGLLQVDATEPRDFGPEDTEFLRTYATILGPVIDRLFKVRQLSSAEERFRLTVEEATDYAIFVTDAQGRIADWLPGAQAVFGWSAEEAVGQPASILFTPEDRERGEDKKEVETARREGHAPDVRWHLRRDGSRVFIEGSTRALHDPQGALTGFLKIGQDVTEQRQAEQALAEGEQRTRSLLEAIPQLVWRAVDKGEWVWASPQWTAYTGQAEADSHGRGWLDPVHPDDRAAAMDAWARAEEAGGFDVEYRLRGRSGAFAWFSTHAAPVRDENGRIVEWVGSSTNVDELRRLQERQEVMVAELQHRTRNLITVVRSIANQTMADTGPTEAFRAAFSDRLAALARVQGLLSRAEQEPITLRALLKLELDALGATDDSRVSLDGPPVRLRPSTVQTLALALHELATNARKYGALGDGGGRLGVAWRLRNADGGRRLHIEWREEGLALADAAQPLSEGRGGGYGRQLIERALPYALSAETTYELAPTRLCCTIDLPLD